MPLRKFTDRTVTNLKPKGSKQVDYFDTATRGFRLRVSPGGTKAWFVKYVINGTQQRDPLGEYPTVKLGEARTMALDKKHMVAHGIDPRIELRMARARRQDTFETTAAEFIKRHASKNRRGEDTARIVERELLPIWGDRAISDITRRDVVEVLDGVMDRGTPYAANRLLAVVRKLFGWAIERGIVDSTPVANISAPGKETKRHRFLSDDEIQTLWQGCDAVGWPYGPFVQLLLLTAQRRGELASVKWDDLNGLDSDQPVWTLPREATKADRAHSVPLSPQAARIFEDLPRTGEFVFSTGRRGDQPLSGFGKSKQRLDMVTDLSEWRFHDLRRSAASIMARLNTPPYILSRVLNHAPSQQEGVTAVYNRHAYEPEKRHALEALGHFVENLVEPTPAKVISLR
jgi:integrase